MTLEEAPKVIPPSEEIGVTGKGTDAEILESVTSELANLTVSGTPTQQTDTNGAAREKAPRKRAPMPRGHGQIVGTSYRAAQRIAGVPNNQRPSRRANGRKDNPTANRAATYKTEICRSHRDLGYCEYEDKCQFAHGVEQLRPRKFSPKYKTQLCKNYHKFGNCRFGSRCQFIHDEHRIQVSPNEFWLISPSENLVRIEVVDKGPEDAKTNSDAGTLVATRPAQRPGTVNKGPGAAGSEVMTLPMHEMPISMPPGPRGPPYGTYPRGEYIPDHHQFALAPPEMVMYEGVPPGYAHYGQHLDPTMYYGPVPMMPYGPPMMMPGMMYPPPHMQARVSYDDEDQDENEEESDGPTAGGEGSASQDESKDDYAEWQGE